MVRVGEHYRPTTDAHASGVYRVVGTTDGVTLLRVTDVDDARANTGELLTVDDPTLSNAFERAADPDAGRTPVRDLENLCSGLYWSVRRFL